MGVQDPLGGESLRIPSYERERERKNGKGRERQGREGRGGKGFTSII